MTETITALALQHKGGKWLAAAREYLKWNVMGGDRCTWGSEDRLPITVKQIEELASYVACAAINEERSKPITVKPSQRLSGDMPCYLNWNSPPDEPTNCGTEYGKSLGEYCPVCTRLTLDAIAARSRNK